jgi:hypothetical protein
MLVNCCAGAMELGVNKNRVSKQAVETVVSR